MALVPYTITALERDTADATASGKNVVVGASCSMFIQPADTVVLLYDDANGTNPSTAKTTGANGQVVVYVKAGEYRVSVNGQNTFINLSDGDVKVFDNIDDMKAYDLLVGDYVTCKRYYSGGELVDGLVYEIVASATGTADSGSFHDLSNGNQAQLIISNGVNVKHFGAAGDASTNDTTSIQNAINFAASSNSGVIYFPSSHYIVDTIYDSYDVTNNPNFPQGILRAGRITLQGEQAVSLNNLLFTDSNFRGTLIETTSTTGPALKLGNGAVSGTETARRQVVRDISFKGVTTGAVVELDNAEQHVLLENLTIQNKGGVGGIGLHIYGRFYASKVSNVRVSSSGTGGTGILCEVASMCLFDTINVTDCGGTAWILGIPSTGVDNLGLGTGNSFINCQVRKSSNGVEIRGGRSNFFNGWWLEQQTGDFDLKIHENAINYTFQNMYLISTELSVSSAIFGGDTGVSFNDACYNIILQGMSFHFCGPTSAQSGILKRGSCSNLTVNKCSFKSNGGSGIKIDTTLGVTPTELNQCNFNPVGAGAEMSTTQRVVDQTNAAAQWLVRGLNTVGTISADLDMSSWTHLPDCITCSTIVNINVTLPTDVSQVIGKTLSLRKSLAGNALTVTGSIEGAASINATADESITSVRAFAGSLYSQIS